MSRQAPPRNDRFEDYVPVAERVEQFHQRFPEGRLITTIVDHDRESGFVLIRAEAYRHADDAVPAATGHAYEYKDSGYVQRTSYIEVAETSAVGRALALLGFEVRRGIASREELEKAARTTPQPERPAARAATAVSAREVPTVSTPEESIAEESATKIDQEILHSAGELGYDAAKVKRWIDQKFKVTGGLESIPLATKREVLKLFREQVSQLPVKEA